ncbi:MAG: hypothetical protein P4L99_13315 [Chthoniobacter sp.]|nr:hypothetical protein [Chthoniobacter sp.]
MIATLFNLAGPDLVILAICAIPTFIMWPIMRKAGYHPAWALIALLPGGMVALCLFLAFAQWPVLPVAPDSSPDLPSSPGPGTPQ